MYRARLFFVAALVLSTVCSAAAQVRGTVTSGEESSPVEGALVFISGTSLQTTSNAEGEFELPDPGIAQFYVVARQEGLGSAAYRVPVGKKAAAVDLALTAAGADGSEASVGPPDDKALAYFEDVAFAWSKASGDMTISNPDVLRIERGDGAAEITASATGPLHLENEHLGYHITIYDFWLQGSPEMYHWSGHALFEPMSSDRSRTERRWHRNRESTYEGSLRHFLRALADGDIKSEEFEAYHVRTVGDSDKSTPVAEMGETGFGYNSINPLLQDGRTEETRELMWSGWVRVEFLGNAKNFGVASDESWVRYVDRYFPQTATTEMIRKTDQSWVGLPRALATMDPSGLVLSEQGEWPLEVRGYWSFKRLADELPINYVPED